MDRFDREPEKTAETKAARNLGESVAKKFGMQAPINVQRIMSEGYGMVVQEVELTENISALVDLDTKQVVINSSMSKPRARFTLAHELGHIVLNHKTRRWTEYGVTLGSNPDQPLEEEANAFASGLLMPAPLLRLLIKEGKKPDQIAELLEVSKEALWISLKTNNLIKKLLG